MGQVIRNTILLLLLSVQSFGQVYTTYIGTGAVAASTGLTLSAIDKDASWTLSSGNKVGAKTSAGWTTVKCIVGYGTSTDSFYIRAVLEVATSANAIAGLCDVSNVLAPLNNYVGSSANGWGYYASIGWVINSGGAVNFLPTFAVGDTVGIAFNMRVKRAWIEKNGTWLGSGDPDNNINPSITGLTGTIIPAFSGQSTTRWRILVTAAEQVRAKPTKFNYYP